jgi:tetratricopeptide (TPR) repeat protein
MADEKSIQGGATSKLKFAIQAARAGRRQEAHYLLQEVVAADPSSEVAWLWLAGVAGQPEEALAALDRVAQLNPDHPRLAAARQWAESQASAELREQAQTLPNLPTPNLPIPNLPTLNGLLPTWSQHTWVILVSLALVLVVCVFVWVLAGQSSEVQARLAPSPTPDRSGRVVALQPELNAALAESRWEDAVAVLRVMRALDPDNTALAHQFVQVSYQLALSLRDQGHFEDALAALDEALVVGPENGSLQKEQRLLDAYREGVDRHQAGDWQGTIRFLSPVHDEDPAYLHVDELLYSSFYNLGLAQQAASDLVAAQASYRSAVELLPKERLARVKAAEVARLLQPPTPIPTPPPPTPEPGPQRIVVDISEQRMYVYEGEELRWEWVVSTGEPGRDTAMGNFKIQSKIPMAYASTWNLDMPHWLGIYWSGPLENGIHALPIVRHTGNKLWDGFLGQRVSYGCVILSDENAETLFNWVEMGTPVVIQP